jgi:hypothetical protein
MQILPLNKRGQTDTLSIGRHQILVWSLYQVTGPVNDLEKN